MLFFINFALLCGASPERRDVGIGLATGISAIFTGEGKEIARVRDEAGDPVLEWIALAVVVAHRTVDEAHSFSKPEAILTALGGVLGVVPFELEQLSHQAPPCACAMYPSPGYKTRVLFATHATFLM
jgi:hypothetical protein